jgi:hypothetical protein
MRSCLGIFSCTTGLQDDISQWWLHLSFIEIRNQLVDGNRLKKKEITQSHRVIAKE